MRRVPGTDDFVTVTTDLSPSDFHLYRQPESGAAEYVNESPYHGDFRVTNVYGFDRSPATHLITDAGLLLNIYGDDCGSMASSFKSGCFVKDGSIGIPTGAQLFIGLDTDADRQVFALVDANSSWFDDEKDARNPTRARGPRFKNGFQTNHGHSRFRAAGRLQTRRNQQFRAARCPKGREVPVPFGPISRLRSTLGRLLRWHRPELYWNPAIAKRHKFCV